jgi:phosphoglycolate phosphatase-like HAD superfamily hydrolase
VHHELIVRATILLFDIDGTLVSTGGAGRRAMVATFRALVSRDDVFEGTSFAGMTDRAIVRHGLRVAGHPDSEDAIDRALDMYLGHLEKELVSSAGYRVLPGVVALLDALASSTRVAIGLGTGNVKRGAHAKLTPGKIHDRFAFGGFGCDAEDRSALLRAGAARGAALLGADVGDCRVVVIGDTPKDVAAAHAIGAACVAVGTGGFAPSSLIELGAKHAFATLDEAAVLAALLD